MLKNVWPIVSLQAIKRRSQTISQRERVNGKKNAPLYTQINQIFMIHCFTVNTLNPQTHIVFGRAPLVAAAAAFFATLLFGKHYSTCRDFTSSKQCYLSCFPLFSSFFRCSRNNHDFIAFFFFTFVICDKNKIKFFNIFYCCRCCCCC